MKPAQLKQAQDDSWTLEITHESGLTEVLLLGRHSKEAAQREALARVRSDTKVLCLDKDVMQAIAEGRVREIIGELP